LGELKLGKRVLKTPAVCGAVMGNDVEEMESTVALAVKQGADLIEIRADSLKDGKGLSKLFRGDLPVIFTNRPKHEGGNFRGTEEKRTELILEAIGNGASCVDLEISTPGRLRKRVVKEARQKGVSVLISHHNFSITPSAKSLLGIARKMSATGGDLIKIVTFAKDVSDSMRILDFLIEAQEPVTVPVIAFAMGEPGRISRVASLLLGSPFTYASVGKPTALGQLSVVEAKQLLRKLTLKRG